MNKLNTCEIRDFNQWPSNYYLCGEYTEKCLTFLGTDVGYIVSECGPKAADCEKRIGDTELAEKVEGVEFAHTKIQTSPSEKKKWVSILELVTFSNCDT